MFWNDTSWPGVHASVGRRAVLALGGLAGIGTSRAFGAPESVANAARAKRCVILFLTGGPPQTETWDPKPEAPVEVRGELGAIPTSVPGIQFGELFPETARLADRLCVVRSVTHGDTTHTSAGYTMLTGRDHPQANAVSATLIRPSPDDSPHLGSLVSKFRRFGSSMPPFVTLPEIIRDDVVNEYPGLSGGFLGRAYDPLLVEADVGAGTFRRPLIALPDDVSAHRLEDRRRLLGALDRSRRFDGRSRVLGEFQDRAFDLLRSSSAQQAFDIDREPASVRAAYGPHLFGQGCLLARRLLEADVGLVTVYWHYEGPKDSPVWDTHANNIPHLKNRLAPPADRGIACLLRELSERGLLEDTLFVCLGEFGRSPRINREAGRDHWPQAQSILMAGAGIQGGTVYGATDRTGAAPAERPVSPADFTATVLHLLGVRPDQEFHDQTGRPHRASEGTPIAELVT